LFNSVSTHYGSWKINPTPFIIAQHLSEHTLLGLFTFSDNVFSSLRSTDIYFENVGKFDDILNNIENCAGNSRIKTGFKHVVTFA
jgi:hypothetical protein